jgi:hypothetical protein
MVLPFNQQNAFGLVLLELYTATGDNKYRERAIRLAASFESEFEYTSNGGLIWHYWPGIFYDGWTAADDVSDNTPNKIPQVDNLYEDVSHASINIAFIFRFMAICGNNIFTFQDIGALRKTLENIRYGEKYSRFISGDIDYQSPLIRFRPGFAWIQVNDVKLKEQYMKVTVAYGPIYEFSLLLQVNNYFKAVVL